MLYDNAQLARVYLHAWQVTGKALYRTIVEETLDFEGHNILEFVAGLERRAELAGARRKLFEVRERRVHPGCDDKVLTSWNGLMLAAFAEAARVLDREDYRRVAERNASFLLRELRTDDGRLLRTWKLGEAKLNGYLEDYSYLIEGFIELYQTTFDGRWYQAAYELAETMIARFRAEDGGFYDTSDDHEALITRPRDLQDNATPSGNAMAAAVLLKLGGLAVEPRFTELARETLSPMQSMMAQYPLGFGQWLQALSYTLSNPREIALVGDPTSEDTRALLAVLRDGYRPHQVVALGSSDKDALAVPILRHRTAVDGWAAAYVCINRVCQPPVTDLEELTALVDRR